MPSGWSVVRGEIESVLQGAPFLLRRIKAGATEDSEGGVAEAGDNLARDGYLIAPRTLDRGERMELVSTERKLSFDLLLMAVVGSDFDVSSDALIQRCELVIQSLRDCNKNVPHAAYLDLNGPIQFREVSGESTQIVATLQIGRAHV